MAQSWYLLESPHSSVSGFENGDFETPFLEALEEIGIDVELYNYDLSECTQIKAIVQNRVQDTKLQSFNRHLIVPIGTCKAGMYVKYQDKYWIITSNIDNNGVYEKAVMTICNWKLEWIGTDGKIVERWCYITSASQYNNGETGMKFYFVRSDQLYITIPDDDESLLIDDRHRFVIDKKCRLYEKSFDGVDIDTSNLLSTYMLTRSDNVLYDYQGDGVVCFIATQDEQHENDGFYRVDGVGHWLCDIPVSTNTNEPNECSISYESNIIYNGLDESVFTAEFGGSSVTAQWSIVNCDFDSELEIVEANNAISISVDNPELNNKSFDLQLTGDGYDTATVTIQIRPFI